jgi:electron-transferring-flavoprotein dehydrogenase
MTRLLLGMLTFCLATIKRLKHHPYISKLLSGDSTRLAYGARSLTEGGLQSLPQLHFPGGALIGCSAGVVNVAKIKGTHNAMKTGMLAAEAAFDAVFRTDVDTSPADMSAYSTAFKNSWVYADLHEVRNLRPSFHSPLGIWGGIAYSGIDSLFLRGRTPWTLHNPRLPNTSAVDAASTRPATEYTPIDYPQPQPPLSTDLLTSLALTGTNHAEDQPIHLRVDDAHVREHVRVNVNEYAGLLGRACPAGVYEYVDDPEDKNGYGGKKLVINSQVSWSPG